MRLGIDHDTARAMSDALYAIGRAYSTGEMATTFGEISRLAIEEKRAHVETSESLRAERHNRHEAEASLASAREQIARLEAELAAAVEAMGRTSDAERALMQIAGIACNAAADVVARGRS